MNKISDHERFNLFVILALVRTLRNLPGCTPDEFMTQLNAHLHRLGPGAPDRLMKYLAQTDDGAPG